jgi:hypothetical protein
MSSSLLPSFTEAIVLGDVNELWSLVAEHKEELEAIVNEPISNGLC